MKKFRNLAMLSRITVIILYALAFKSSLAFSQTPSEPAPTLTPAPYASLDRTTVSYQGPGRSTANDLPGSTVSIGLLLPLQGKHAAQGHLLLAAAQQALVDENAAAPLPDGRQIILAVRNENERWGQASSNMVELIEQQYVAVLITAFDGEIAHQAEQVANKLSVPVISLSTDLTTTQVNIPWIFRLGPSDTEQALLMTAEIAAHPAYKNILLVSEADHDGRIAAREFLNAAKHNCPLANVQSLEINSSSWEANFWQQQIKMSQPDVLVLWTNPESAFHLLAIARSYRQDTLALLSRKSAQYSTSDTPAVYSESRGVSQNHQQVEHEFVVLSGGWVNFAGVDLPYLATSEIYLAVRIAASALRHTGPNRARLRAYLASGSPLLRVSDSTVQISFDPAGNSVTDFLLVPRGKLAAASDSEDSVTQTNLPLSTLN
jgi:ABC-type branched-subunit amino acid transport system substrate-binding protein